MGQPSSVGNVPSPCVSICVMDDGSGLCTGCQRTLDEIAVWGMLDDAEKRAVWDEIAARRGAARSTIAEPGTT